MLIINLKNEDVFDESRGIFISIPPTTVRLEHSLVSLSKWESIYERPFLPTQPGEARSEKDFKSYVECMVIGSISQEAFEVLWALHKSDIKSYIDSPNSATVITRLNNTNRVSRSYVTSELIYYWMIRFSIPFEAQRWHLNRLLILIDICNIKESGKKMPLNDIYRRNRELNAARRAELGSKG